MSYSLSGSIVDAENKKVLVKLCDVSFLKNLNERRYSCSFEYINPLKDVYSKDFPSVVSYDSCDFYAAVKRVFLDKLNSVKKYKSNSSPSNIDDGFVAESSEIEQLDRSVIDEFSIDTKVLFEMFQNKDSKMPDDVVSLYVHTINTEDGFWFDKKSFEDGLDHYMKKLNDAKDKFSKLFAIKTSKDYYELSDNAKSDLLEDVSCAEEEMNDVTYQVESIKKIIDILDFYENDYAFEVENSEGLDYADRYTWSYSDKRDIKIFISVS